MHREASPTRKVPRRQSLRSALRDDSSSRNSWGHCRCDLQILHSRLPLRGSRTEHLAPEKEIGNANYCTIHHASFPEDDLSAIEACWSNKASDSKSCLPHLDTGGLRYEVGGIRRSCPEHPWCLNEGSSELCRCSTSARLPRGRRQTKGLVVSCWTERSGSTRDGRALEDIELCRRAVPNTSPRSELLY